MEVIFTLILETVQNKYRVVSNIAAGIFALLQQKIQNWAMFLWPQVRPLKAPGKGFFKEFKVGNFDIIHVGNPLFISTESNIGCLTFQNARFPVLISGLTH
jgi:hypothetical protein